MGLIVHLAFDGGYTVAYDPQHRLIQEVRHHGVVCPDLLPVNPLTTELIQKIMDLEMRLADAASARTSSESCAAGKCLAPESAGRGTMAPSCHMDLYVDGACLVQPDALQFGWAYRLLTEQGEVITEFATTDVPLQWASARNVAAELKATIEGLRRAQGLHATSVTVYHDYEGIGAWADGRWKAKQPMTQDYLGFLREYPIPVRFIHVRAHAGHPHNERVDALATQAARAATPVPLSELSSSL
jgi:ribonuclease HI